MTSALYLLACAVTARALSHRFFTGAEHDWRVSRPLVFVTLLAVTFFGGFYVLGFLELATNRAIVSAPYEAGLSCVAALLSYFLRSTRIARSREPWSIDGIVRVTSVVTLVLLIGTAFILTAGFPKGYEARGYHLPIALHMVQSASLKVWDVAFPLTLNGNASIYYGYLLGFLPERLVSASDMLFLIPIGMATYGLSRATGSDDTAAWFATLGMLTIPMIAFGAAVAEADVGGVAFLAIAVYFVVAPERGRPSYRVLAGLSAGLAYGFKLFHIVAIVILCALIVVETLNAPGTRSAGRRIWRAGGATLEFLGAAMATSSFWLIRNYAQLGNPFYPWHLPVFNLVGWAKPPDLADALYTEAQFWWVRTEPGWLAYPWIEGLGPEHQFGSQTGLGLFFAAAVPIACLASLLGVMRGRGRERQTLAFLLGSGLMILLGWWAGPHQPRYALGAMVCLIPLFAWTLTHTRGRHRLALEGIAGVAICGMALVFFSVNLITTRRSLAPTWHLPSRRAANRYPGALDRLPPGSTVMNLGQRVWNYALFGEDHRNRVVSYEQAIRTMSSVSPPCYYPIFGVCEKADIVLDPNVLRRLGVTHIFTLTPLDGIPVRGCWHVHQVDRLDDDVMKRSLYLYQIAYCDDANGS